MLTRSDRRRILGVLVHRLPELGLGRLVDPRNRRGRRHALGDLLAMAMIGLTAGARTLREVEALCGDLGRAVREKLGVRRLVADTTLRDLLVAMSPDTLRMPSSAAFARRSAESRFASTVATRVAS